MRILFAGPGGNGKYGGKFFYAFHRRLINGFIRAGHFVFPFSDRDTADYALGARVVGRFLANRRLCEVARDMKPDVLVLFHCDLISRTSIQEIKRDVPGVKVAVVSIDDLGHPRPASLFRRLLGEADVGFATTGGALLREFSNDAAVAYIPNVVDVSIDNEISYEKDTHAFDYFFGGNQPAIDERWTFVTSLEEKLNAHPSGLRSGFFGKARGNALSGARYIKTLGQGKVGLNLSRRNGNLYASDRMGQYLGNGLLLATQRNSGFENVFNETEMLFFDDLDELVDGLIRVVPDDTLWRKMARAGRDKGMRLMSDLAVAELMISLVCGQGSTPEWAFGDHIFDVGSA